MCPLGGLPRTRCISHYSPRRVLQQEEARETNAGNSGQNSDRDEEPTRPRALDKRGELDVECRGRVQEQWPTEGDEDVGTHNLRYHRHQPEHRSAETSEVEQAANDPPDLEDEVQEDESEYQLSSDPLLQQGSASIAAI